MPNDYTKDSIKAAFIKLLNERPLNKISVKSIVDICNISRNTFYYHFQDIPRLLAEIIIDSANTLVKENDTVKSMGECIETAFAYVKANKKAVHQTDEKIIRHEFPSGVEKSALPRLPVLLYLIHNSILSEKKAEAKPPIFPELSANEKPECIPAESRARTIRGSL